MANLPESVIYPTGVFQLELDTPVIGGTPAFDGGGAPISGFSNAQAKQLADRTAFLKAGLDNIPLQYERALTAGMNVTIDRTDPDNPIVNASITGGGGGDVVGPASSVNNSVALFDGITGKLIKNGGVLGTASTANVTTSAIDTTDGRVMKVGDAGILGLTATTANADALPHGIGMYAYNFDVATLNPPLGQVDNWSGVETGSALSNRGFTIAGCLGGGRVAFRTRAGGVNAAWREVWTSIGSNSVVVDTGSIGYGTGSGGAVTQATSKSTAVTLNKPSGRVTTTADSLAAGAEVSFQLSNSKIAATDILLVSSVSAPGAASYKVSSWGVQAGFCYIRIANISAAAQAHAININFVVIKGAIA